MFLLDFFTKLFDTHDYPARWFCGNWEAFVGWLHIGSDIVIWLAYMAIPALLLYFIKKKKGEIPFNYVFLLFCAFIFWCGTVHLIEATIFWHPWYRLSGLIKFITAVVSVLTVLALYKVIPEALNLKSSKDLEEAVEEKTEELKRSNENLEQFAYIASHDLQEPLRMIGQNVEILKSQLGPQLDEKSNKKFDFILDGYERMYQMIDDLLEFSRLKPDQDRKVKVDLNQTMVQVQRDLGPQIEDSKANVVYSKLPAINGIAHQIHALFLNLIANSIKYRNKDKAPQIEVHAEEKQNGLVITVSDNGIGFKQEYAEKIFQLYQRLHSKSDYPGTGIGLAACKKIVENHSGLIWAESESGQGSKFFIKLPLQS